MIAITVRLQDLATTTGNRRRRTYYYTNGLLLTTASDYFNTESGDRIELEQLVTTMLQGTGYIFTESGDRLIAENNDLLNLE